VLCVTEPIEAVTIIWYVPAGVPDVEPLEGVPPLQAAKPRATKRSTAKAAANEGRFCMCKSHRMVRTTIQTSSKETKPSGGAEWGRHSGGIIVRAAVVMLTEAVAGALEVGVTL
jgi:hypothetical protein